MSKQVIKALGGVEDLLLGNVMQVQRRGSRDIEVNGLCAMSLPRDTVDGQTIEEALISLSEATVEGAAVDAASGDAASGKAFTYEDVGTVNAIVLEYAYSTISVTTLFSGMLARFKPAVTNTGSVTVLHPLQSAASQLVTQSGSQLAAGDLQAGEAVDIEWDGASAAFKLAVVRSVTESSSQTAEHLTATTTGTGVVLAASPEPPWPDLLKDREILLTFHTALGRLATLSVSGTPARPLRRLSAAGTLVDVQDGDIRIAERHRISWSVAADCYIVRSTPINQLVRNYAVWDAAGAFRSQTMGVGTVMDHGIGDFSIPHNIPCAGLTYPNAAPARDSVVVSGMVKEFEAIVYGSSAKLKLSDLALDDVISETSVRVNTVNDIGPIDPEWVSIVIHGGGEQ